MLNSITLTDQCSVLVKRRYCAECSRSGTSGHAVALPKNLIVVPRADFTTATAQRYRSLFSSVHAKEKSRQEPAAQHNSTVHQ